MRSFSKLTFILRPLEYRSIFGHETTDDHTDVITNITSLPELGLFVSTSKDMTLKLWDLEGALIREVQFQQPLNAISACNAKGDLILGINDRLDIFKGHHCKTSLNTTIKVYLNSLDLPPNYIWAVSKMTWKEDVKEDPIDFDANFDPKAQYVSEYEGLITKKPR